jgi:hypothetical protein
MEKKKYLFSVTFSVRLRFTRSRGSSVSILSDHGLDDRAIGVRSQAGANDFSSNLCVQTGSEALLYNGYRGSFPRRKA